MSTPRRYDELLDADGSVRPHWRTLVARLGADGAAPIRRGAELARRLIIENGVTYNVYADPQGRDRPWALDPLPMLLTAEEWRDIEIGVLQRARLFDALLADLYGAQTVLKGGIVPPDLPFGHPNFLWPCHGVRPAGGRWLHIHAVDIARDADGRWWVLADRTQTPSGMGYALENRQIVTRLFPDSISDLGVCALSETLAALRAGLQNGETADEAPLAVVLTPGTFNETYFEHAYLARQLGFPLVEGHDLTVRGDTVFLKTLGGLRRVHTILRRLDDDYCDPVELRGDSALGVPGLIGAVRAGRVMIANALGSGVLESAAWMGFVPLVSQRLLGETLRLPSVATWWCGERPALEFVIENLERLVIKPTYPNQRFDPVFGRQLDADSRALLIDRLRARPGAYVAQERLVFSQAPIWQAHTADGVTSRALGIRVYAVATADGYRIMPGGLARIAADAAADVVSMQRGGASKDLWVLAAGRRGPDQMPAPATAPEVTARAPLRHVDLPSRLAENLFWLGRYSERCEGKARLLRSAYGVRANPAVWPQALEACRQFGLSGPNGDGPTLFDAANPLSLAADLQRLGWCAAQARSRLSAENWRAVGVLQREFQDADEQRADPRETLDRMLLSLAALAGFANDMTQDDGWRLMMLGRRLERLQFLSDLLGQELAAAGPPTQAELEWWLDIGDSTITYRTRYLAAPRLAATIELLVFDRTNPRALAFQWREIDHALRCLADSLGGVPDDTLDAAVEQMEQCRSALIEGDQVRAARGRQSLSARCGELAAAAGRLSDRVSLRHFSLIDADLRMVAA